MGVFVILFVPARWTAKSHVILNLLKPDPVTGLVISEESRSYVATQIALIKDYSVVGPTVDRIGWLSDPNLIERYQRRSSNDTRDFRHWLSQLITDRTKAEIEDGSNILTISFTWSDPTGAKLVANSLLQSYLETSLNFRRAKALFRNAEWYNFQSIKAKAELDAADKAQNAYERENGIVLSPDDKTDVDSARLAAMTVGGAHEAASGSSVDAQLAETDALIRDASLTMGPNNPQLQALQAKRAAYAALLAKQHAASEVGSGAGSGTDIEVQKQLVIARRAKLGELKNLQTEVDIRRDLYNKTSQREVDFRQQAAVTDAGLTALGNATVPAAPTFPNKPLIFGGCLGLGLVLGSLIALLIELLNRRVRGPEDVIDALGVPLLAILKLAV